DVSVKDKNGCPASASMKQAVNPAVTVTAKVTAGPDCDGNVTLTATASGGSGTFSDYCWSVDGAACKSTGTSNQFTTKLAAGDHNITVTVTDDKGCTATSDKVPVTINKPVSVSAS